VKGHIDGQGNGVADSIDFSNNVEGPISSIDLVTSRFVVLGQTVIVDANTSFDDSLLPADLTSLKVSDRVEVSGLVNSSGNIVASRIELAHTATTMVELSGVISALDSNAHTFDIGTQNVDYSSVSLVNFTPANGDTVEVHGTLNSNNVLIASRVEAEDEDHEVEHSSSSASSTSSSANSSSTSAAATHREIEGLVTRFASTADFDVAGRAVTTTSNTRFENGTMSDLALDVRLEVEGSANASGVLVADKVQFRIASDVRLEAKVDAVDATAGTVSLLGVTVKFTAITRYEDKSAAKIERFSLKDLSAGDFVEIRAGLANGVLTATRLERDTAQSIIKLRGPVDSVAAPVFTLVGITVNTDSSTKFESDGSVSLSSTQFFASAMGQSVGVEGTVSGNVVTATKVELRGNDD